MLLNNVRGEQMDKKRGQHYVWRYYLTAWTDEFEQLYCLRENKLFLANPKKVAKARDFYRLRDLSQNEITIIEKGFIDGYGSKEIQELNKNWIELFTNASQKKDLLKQAGKWDEDKESELDVYMNNLVEDFHSEIENGTISYLNSMKNEDINFLKDKEKKLDFLFFLSLQYFRSKMMKHNVLRSFAAGPISINSNIVENVWSILYFILATNLAHSLGSKSDYRFLFLRNKGGIPFITGDQPVINTYANYANYENETKNLELYYPLGPSLALLLTDSKEYISNQDIFDVQESNVMEYNKQIFNASEEQIYSNDETYIQKFREK
jgi:hypothetical protein